MILDGRLNVMHTKCYGEKAYAALAFLAYARTQAFYVMWNDEAGKCSRLKYSHDLRPNEMHSREDHAVLAADDEVLIVRDLCGMCGSYRWQDHTSKVLRAAAKKFIQWARGTGVIGEDTELFFIPCLSISSLENDECIKLLKRELSEDYRSEASGLAFDFHKFVPYCYRASPAPLKLADFTEVYEELAHPTCSKMLSPIETEVRKNAVRELFRVLLPMMHKGVDYSADLKCLSRMLGNSYADDWMKCLSSSDLEHGFLCMADEVANDFWRGKYWEKMGITAELIGKDLECFFQTDSFKHLRDSWKFIWGEASGMPFPCIRELIVQVALYSRLYA